MCGIPQTPCAQHEAVRPEHVIPKAQGHLTGREGARSQELPCTKQSPGCRWQEGGILEDRGLWEKQGCQGWGRPEGQSQSLAAYRQEE